MLQSEGGEAVRGQVEHGRLQLDQAVLGVAQLCEEGPMRVAPGGGVSVLDVPCGGFLGAPASGAGVWVGGAVEHHHQLVLGARGVGAVGAQELPQRRGAERRPRQVHEPDHGLETR